MTLAGLCDCGCGEPLGETTEFDCPHCDREFASFECLEQHDIDSCERDMAESERVDNQWEEYNVNRDR